MHQFVRPFYALIPAFVAASILLGSAIAQTQPLSFRVIDAEFSSQLGRIVMISANPNRLHVLDPVAQTVQSVNLPRAPLSVSVGPSGLRAAVGHDTLITLVDLTTVSVEKTLTVPAIATNVILAANYVYEATNFSVRISDGVVTQDGYSYSTNGRLHPNGNTIYYTQDGISPNDVGKVDVSAGPMSARSDSPYHGDFPFCGGIWFSPDGKRIYNGCGTVSQVSALAKFDLTYVTRFPTPSLPSGVTLRLTGLTESAATNTIAVIPEVPSWYYPSDYRDYKDNQVHLFESAYLRPIGRFILPDFVVASKSYEAHGKYVFFDSAGTSLYVVMQADATSGLLNDFAIHRISLNNPGFCSAVFDASTATASGVGGPASVGITGPSDCTRQAFSEASWIQLISGYYGSGNGPLQYFVRPNTSAASRSGTIRMGGQALTVTQEAKPAPAGMNLLAYDIVDVEYSKAMDRLILVSKSPDELHIYNPASRAIESTLPLPRAPMAVSVRPDGLAAAVAHDGWVSFVNLQAATLTALFPTITDAADIVYAGNGYAYVFPVRAWSDIYSMVVATGDWTATSAIYDGRKARLHASGRYLYVGDSSWSSKWLIENGVAEQVRGGIPACSELWLAESGNRAFNGCAKVYRTSEVVAEDGQYNGQLGTLTSLTGLAHSSRRGTAVALVGSSLSAFGDDFLGPAGEMSLPKFTAGGAQFDAEGRYVFWNSDATSLVVVAKAPATANLTPGFAVTAVSIADCATSVAPASTAVGAAINFGEAAVSAPSGCLWAASSNAPWLKVTSGGAGFGNASISYSADANSTGGARTGVITVGGRTLTITQSAGATSLSLSPTLASASGSGGTGSFNVTASPSTRPWTATSNASWITLTSGASGTGNGTVAYAVAANPGAARSGTISVNSATFTINQAAVSTSLVLESSTINVSSSGGTSTVNVFASPSTFAWTATSNASWITIASGASGTGNGAISFSVAPNTGPQRIGSISVNSSTLNVVQAEVPASQLTLGQTSASASSVGGSGSVTVNATPSTLAWTAVSNASWITITSGASGTGNGTVAYSVAPNTGASRSGTISVNSLTFTVNQAAAASGGGLSLGQSSATASSGGGAGEIIVVGTGSWTATANASWLSIVSGGSGTGNGTVNYSVARNTAGGRSGTVTVGTLTFTVTQQAGPVAAPASWSGLQFVPVNPCRLADTRLANGPFGGPSLAANSDRSFSPVQSNCGIPSNAAAYSLNVTVVPQGPLGWITIYPTGTERPFASTLNSVDGRVKANAAIVPAGTAGAVSVFATDATQVVLDVNGYFVAPGASSQALAYYPVKPCRVSDTREASGSLGGPIIASDTARSFPVLSAGCGIPATARAYSLNATVVPTKPLGYLTLWPTGQNQPFVSTLNSPKGSVVANAAMVPAGAGGAVSAYVTDASHLVLDITGYFAPAGQPGGLRFFALNPCRVFDSRDGNKPAVTPGGTIGVQGTGQCGIETSAQAFSLNATVIPAGGPLGYLTLWPTAQSQPFVSTLNAPEDKIVANAAVVPSGSNGQFSAFVTDAAHMVFDTNGYFAP